jgi:hypothetical protein
VLKDPDSWLGGGFYIGYLVAQFPMGYLLGRFPSVDPPHPFETQADSQLKQSARYLLHDLGLDRSAFDPGA